MLFGSGDAKTGKLVGGGAAQGRALKDQFFAGLPALGKLVSDLQAQWRRTAKKRFNPKFRRMEYYNGTIVGLDGRPIIVPSEHQILVYLLQSDEAIHMSAAYNLINKRLKARWKYGEDFGVVCFYHDEATVECKEEIAEEVKLIMEASIKDAAEFYGIKCPHKGNGAIGKDWYSIH